MTIHGAPLTYHDGERTCEGHLAHDGHSEHPRPCVVVVHAWDGLNDAVRRRTEQFARAGHLGFALDLYGQGIRGDPLGDNSHLMDPLLADRGLLRRRLLAGVRAAQDHPLVDPARIVVLGYCFGGLCALDVARSGAPGVRGVVSVHGVLSPPDLPTSPITAAVLVVHGWEDPVAPPAAVLALATELTRAGADWQLHAHGHAMHAFTLPAARMPGRGLQYHPRAARRGAIAIDQFLAETLQPVTAGSSP